MGEPESVSSRGQSAHSAVPVLLIAIGLVLALILAWIGRVILLLLFASIVVAVFFTAVVEWIKTKVKVSHSLAFSLFLLASIVFVTLVFWLSGPSIVDQIAVLRTALPQAAGKLVTQIQDHGWGRWLLAQWSDYSQLSENVGYALTRIGGIVLSTASLAAGLFIVLSLSIYLAAEPLVYFSGIRRITPHRFHASLDACAASIVSSLRWWLVARMFAMLAVGSCVSAGLWILGVPLAGTLGIIAAILTLIPNVGPLLSVVPAALLALAISPTKGLLTLLLFLLVYGLEGNVITPLLERRIVRLPPALTLTAQLLLAAIAGPLGLALAAPLTAAMLGVSQVLLPSDSNSDAPVPPPAEIA